MERKWRLKRQADRQTGRQTDRQLMSRLLLAARKMIKTSAVEHCWRLAWAGRIQLAGRPRAAGTREKESERKGKKRQNCFYDVINLK